MARVHQGHPVVIASLRCNCSSTMTAKLQYTRQLYAISVTVRTSIRLFDKRCQSELAWKNQNKRGYLSVYLCISGWNLALTAITAFNVDNTKIRIVKSELQSAYDSLKFVGHRSPAEVKKNEHVNFVSEDVHCAVRICKGQKHSRDRRRLYAAYRQTPNQSVRWSVGRLHYITYN